MTFVTPQNTSFLRQIADKATAFAIQKVTTVLEENVSSKAANLFTSFVDIYASIRQKTNQPIAITTLPNTNTLCLEDTRRNVLGRIPEEIERSSNDSDSIYSASSDSLPVVSSDRRLDNLENDDHLNSSMRSDDAPPDILHTARTAAAQINTKKPIPQNLHAQAEKIRTKIQEDKQIVLSGIKELDEALEHLEVNAKTTSQNSSRALSQSQNLSSDSNSSAKTIPTSFNLLNQAKTTSQNSGTDLSQSQNLSNDSDSGSKTISSNFPNDVFIISTNSKGEIQRTLVDPKNFKELPQKPRWKQ